MTSIFGLTGNRLSSGADTFLTDIDRCAKVTVITATPVVDRETSIATGIHTFAGTSLTNTGTIGTLILSGIGITIVTGFAIVA